METQPPDLCHTLVLSNPPSHTHEDLVTERKGGGSILCIPLGLTPVTVSLSGPETLASFSGALVSSALPHLLPDKPH